MKTVEIGQVAKVTSSKRIFAKEYVADGIPFFRSKEVGELSRNEEVKTELFISESRYAQIKSKYDIPQKGDLLLTAVGSIGNTWIVDERKFYYKDGNLTLIKPLEKLDVNYLNYFFKSSYFWRSISSNSTGTAYSALTISTLNKIKIPLPPLETQKHIAQILDDAAALRDKTQQLLDEYDQLAQSIFLDMFGDPVVNPKGWEEKDGSSLFVFKSGKYLKNTTENTGEIPVYGGNGIKCYTKQFLINHDTFTIGRVGAYCGAVHQIINQPIWVTDNAIYISEFKQVIDHSYLYFFLTYYNINRFADKSGQPKITQRPLKEMKVALPPLKLQNQFAAKIALIEQQKALAKQELKESEDLFHCLLQRGFKGELTNKL